VSADIPSDLVAALAERYDLRGILGRGGMATVYMAYDRKHQRDVALKVLRPELAASVGADRFLREIQIVARLTHPHILALHDSGEAGGFVYYVSPFIEGGSLRQAMERHGRMDAAQAIAIIEPVADALSYAHRMGVLHRDIKPENILFSQGHPIVADFGIAKAVATATGGNRTRTGLSLGTPGYMSPEQAAGYADLDERTDVYGLAVVAYELIVGEIPGRWPTEDAVRAGRFLEALPTHRARLAAAGSRIEESLVRGLAIRHDQRTETPAAFIDALRGVAPVTPRRKYRTDEIDEIMKRAAELEATNPTSSGAMTIGGVEAIAAEVGIPTDYVRSAAQALEPHAPSASQAVAPAQPTAYNKYLGGPTRVLIERVVEGEVPMEEYPTMVEEIRRLIENVGSVNQIGKSFSWTTTRTSGRMLEVVVTVRGGRTRVVVRENLRGLAGQIFGGIGGGLGGGGMGPIIGISAGVFGANPEVFMLLIPAWLATVAAIARTTYSHQSQRRERKLGELADHLAEIARELIAEPARLGDGGLGTGGR
jgi:serine/threonine protein kinase